MNASSTTMLRIHHGLMTTIATARQIAFVFHASFEPNDRSLPGRINRIGVVRMKIVRAASRPPIAMPDAIARRVVHPSRAFLTHVQASRASMSVASGSVMNMPE